MNNPPSLETKKLVAGLPYYVDWEALYEQYEHELGLEEGRRRVDQLWSARREMQTWEETQKEQERKTRKKSLLKRFTPYWTALSSKMTYWIPRLPAYKADKISVRICGAQFTPDELMNVLAEHLEGDELWHTFGVIQSKHFLELMVN